MRGRILEVPSLWDLTFLREPRRGVARLADVGRDRCGWSCRESYNVELAGYSSARGTRVLHQCRTTLRGVQRCEMQGVVVAVQRSKREHLSAAEGASASGGSLAQQGGQWED